MERFIMFLINLNLEFIMHISTQNIRYRNLGIQKYVATVVPKNKANTKDILQGETHGVCFEELEGGTREYIVTLSSIICDSKMKGTTVRTHLPPYPPQKLTVEEAAPADSADRRCLVSWTRPKGDFSKYSLMVTSLEKTKAQQQRK